MTPPLAHIHIALPLTPIFVPLPSPPLSNPRRFLRPQADLVFDESYGWPEYDPSDPAAYLYVPPPPHLVPTLPQASRPSSPDFAPLRRAMPRPVPS